MLANSRLFASLLYLLASLLAGCTITKSTIPNKRYDIKWHVGESLVETALDSVFDSDDELDRLWEEGYGFNNPNADRNRHHSQAAAKQD